MSDTCAPSCSARSRTQRLATVSRSPLRAVDPDESDHDAGDHHKKQELDTNGEADQPARAPRSLPAPFAVGGVRDQLSAALVACNLGLHLFQYGQGYRWPVDLEEELSPADAVLLMSSVPERIGDLVYGLDEGRLRYRHGPAFPTLGGLIGHLLDSGSKVDALLRHAHLDGLTTADVRATLGPSQDMELERPLQEALEDFARVRRRTVDLLHGWGKNEWDRTLKDPRGAEMTLLEVCRMVARHEIGHIAQIRNLTVLLPEPQDLGPARPVLE